MNIKSDFDYIAKIALLGDSSVGKTNLVLRFTENTFTVNIPPTIGYDYKSKTIILNKSKKSKIANMGYSWARKIYVFMQDSISKGRWSNVGL